MMFRPYSAVLVAVGAAGCGNFAFNAPPGDGGGACGAFTLDYSVEPLVGIDRNAAVDIDIRWEVSDALEPPVIATMYAGPDYELEIEVLLRREPLVEDVPTTYSATQLNPFGLGAPAGNVAVSATAATPRDCLVNLEAVTSFMLR